MKPKLMIEWTPNVYTTHLRLITDLANVDILPMAKIWKVSPAEAGVTLYKNSLLSRVEYTWVFKGA